MAVHSEDIEYHFDRLRLVGELTVDDSTSGIRPAVLVCHEGNGLTDHSKDVAHRLAELGFVAFALDYYGDGKPLAPEDLGARFQELDGDRLRTRAIADAGLQQLLASPFADRRRVAVDRVLLRRHDVAGARPMPVPTSRRSSASTPGWPHAGPQDAANISGRVLVCIGTDDPFVPPEQRAAFEDEMRAGGVDWRMNLYGGAGAQLHQPGRRRDGQPGAALRRDDRRPGRGGRCSTSSPRSSDPIPSFRSGSWSPVRPASGRNEIGRAKIGRRWHAADRSRWNGRSACCGRSPPSTTTSA